MRELVRIVSTVGPSEGSMASLKVIAKSQAPYARLFRVLHEDSNLTEAGALNEIFPIKSNSAVDAKLNGRSAHSISGRYRKVKSRLRIRLLNTLFVLNLSEAKHSEYSQILFTVNRMVFLARVLRVFSSREFSASIAKAGLTKAMMIEEWSSAMEFLSILRSDAARRGAVKAHRLYLAQWDRCQLLLMSEEKAKISIESLQLAFAKTGGENPSHAAEAEKAAEIAYGFAKEFPSFKLSFIALRLRVQATQLRMNYPETLKVCDEAFEILQQYPIFSNHARNSEYALMGLVASVQGRIREGVPRYLALCEEHLDKRKDNWMTLKEFQYIYLMQILAFQAAYRVVQEVLSNPRYGIQTEAVHDRWNLFLLYAELTTGMRVPITKIEDFNVLVHSYTADKAGLNTAMILLHVLLLAERKQFGELRDRIDFIRGYRKRHLKGSENSQMNRLFRMLQLIETCDLHYIKIVRKSRALLDELKKSEETEPIQGEQILPATWIWNRLMEHLREYHPVNTRIS